MEKINLNKEETKKVVIPVVEVKINISKVDQSALLGLARNVLGLKKKTKLSFVKDVTRTKEVQSFVVGLSNEKKFTQYLISSTVGINRWVATKV